MASRELPVPATALAFGAHPDDVEFGAGATLAKWGEAGCVVSLLIATDGSKGSWDPDADLDDLIATRQAEAEDAARALGATGEVRFLEVADGELHNTRQLRSAVARHIRELRPEVLLGHDPWKRYRLHPDHREAGFLVTDGLVAARDPHFFPEHGLEPHRPSALLLFEADEPDHAEAVEERHVDAKIAALESHRSQFVSTMFVSGDDEDRAADELDRFRNRIRTELADAGAAFDLPVAEVFRFMPTDR